MPELLPSLAPCETPSPSSTELAGSPAGPGHCSVAAHGPGLWQGSLHHPHLSPGSLLFPASMATGSWIAANHAHLPELQKQRFASSGCVIARAHEPALSYPHFRRQVQSLMGELQEKPSSGESLLWPHAGTGEHPQPGLHGAPSLRFLGVPHGQARGSPGTNCPGFHKDVTWLFILSPLCGQTLWG